MRELGQDWLALTSAYTLYIDTFSIDLIQQPSHQQCHVATVDYKETEENSNSSLEIGILDKQA